MELITGDNDRGRRLDRILRKALPDHPLALIHRLLRKGQVFINGKPAKAQERLESGASISIPSLIDNKLKPAKHIDPASVTGEFCPAPIWQGSGLLAFNKPAGLAVHGHDSLDTMVGHYLADKLPPSLSFKPGPLHRLDKPTSGIIIFSSGIEGARLFTSLLREHKVKKTYLAIVEGIVEKEEIWEDDLIRDKEKKKTFVTKKSQAPFSKKSVTKITPFVSKNGHSLIQAEITTGRTHQIRAQAAFHGQPLAGDVKYKGQRAGSRERKVEFFLHARKLEFLDYLIEAPLPEAFMKKITALFGYEVKI